MIVVSPCLPYFTWNDHLYFLFYGWIWNYFLLLYVWEILHCVHHLYLLQLAWFPVLAIVCSGPKSQGYPSLSKFWVSRPPQSRHEAHICSGSRDVTSAQVTMAWGELNQHIFLFLPYNLNRSQLQSCGAFCFFFSIYHILIFLVTRNFFSKSVRLCLFGKELHLYPFLDYT